MPPIVIKDNYSGMNAAIHEASLNQKIYNIGGYSSCKLKKREAFFTLMKYFPGIPLNTIEFTCWYNFLKFTISFIEKLKNFHALATHNDLHPGNVLVNNEQVDFIDLGTAELTKAQGNIGRDLYFLWCNLQECQPKSKKTLADYQIEKRFLGVLDQLDKQPLAQSLKQIQGITKEAADFSQKSFSKLHEIFCEKTKTFPKLPSVIHIKSLFGDYKDKENIKERIEIMMSELIKARDNAKKSVALFFKKNTKESLLFDDIICSFKAYLKQYINVPKEKFFQRG